MKSEIVYMLGIVGTGFAVNYLLRALPFAFFGGKSGELPNWVLRAGAYLSPIIIAGLIVYSFATLPSAEHGSRFAFAWPYVAGLITVGLQLWRRNSLVSIVVGTVVFMALLNCGCTTERAIDTDAQNPTIRVTARGVFLGEEKVDPAEIPEMLDALDVPRSRTIHIGIDGDVRNLQTARTLMGYLGKAGYTCPVLVTDRHAESFSTGKRKNGANASNRKDAATSRPTIRYKKANE